MRSTVGIPALQGGEDVKQAVVPRGSNPAAIDGTTAGTLFLALSQSAEHH